MSIPKPFPDCNVAPSTDLPAPRADIRLSVTLTFEESPLPALAISVNLSETGVLVRSGRQAPRGSLVQLEFTEFKAKGELIWTRKTDDAGVLLGMKFVSIGRRDLGVVRSLVEAAGGF